LRLRLRLRWCLPLRRLALTRLTRHGVLRVGLILLLLLLLSLLLSLLLLLLLSLLLSLLLLLLLLQDLHILCCHYSLSRGLSRLRLLLRLTLLSLLLSLLLILLLLLLSLLLSGVLSLLSLLGLMLLLLLQRVLLGHDRLCLCLIGLTLKVVLTELHLRIVTVSRIYTYGWKSSSLSKLVNLLRIQLHGAHRHAVRLHVLEGGMLGHHGLSRMLLLLKQLLLSQSSHGVRVIANYFTALSAYIFRTWKGISARRMAHHSLDYAGSRQRIRVRTLVLELLLLEHLLLGRIHVLQGVSVRVGPWRHRAHQCRVHLSSWR
jgi:hypothetical protein